MSYTNDYVKNLRIQTFKKVLTFEYFDFEDVDRTL